MASAGRLSAPTAGRVSGLALMGLTVIVLATQPLFAAGKVYRWVDSQGRVHYGDQPARNAEEVQLKAPGTVRPAEETPVVPDETSAEVCQRLRDRLETYSSAERIIETDSLGVDREYTAEQREQLLTRTQQQISESCVS